MVYQYRTHRNEIWFLLPVNVRSESVNQIKFFLFICQFILRIILPLSYLDQLALEEHQDGRPSANGRVEGQAPKGTYQQTSY